MLIALAQPRTQACEASSVAPAHEPLRAHARSLYIYLDSC
jgi:hypothetical protein